MSGWVIVTMRGKPSKDYEYSRRDSSDPYHATSDIYATAQEDSRVKKVTSWKGHIYVYMSKIRNEFEKPKEMLEDYEDMLKDAVVLCANDTTDTGEARYWDTGDFDGGYTDRYRETQGEDGCYVGELALSVINARHGIVARDPFHNMSERNCSWESTLYDDGGVRDEALRQ